MTSDAAPASDVPGAPSQGSRPRLTAVRRTGEQVTPLELFFDLIFVLAVTQCTAMMAATPTWTGLARAVLVLATLWWAWVGYAWLTSVVDPEEGSVRFAIFGAMAALLVVTLCIPRAFDGSATPFAIAYGVVRAGQIVLFIVGSRDLPDLRRSVLSLAGSSLVAVSMLGVAASLDGSALMAVWAVAVAIDVLGPYLFGSSGWKLEPASLRRATRLDRPHRPGRVTGGDRRGGQRRTRRRHRGCGRDRRRRSVGDVVDVLRRHLPCRRGSARACAGRHASERTGPRRVLGRALPDDRRRGAVRTGVEEDRCTRDRSAPGRTRREIRTAHGHGAGHGAGHGES